MTTPAPFSRRCFRTTVWMAVPAVLAACGPGETAYVSRQGATVAQADKVTFDCRIAAAREVPADTQVRSTPSWYTPTYTECDTNKKGQTYCVTSGGYQTGGDVYSYDPERTAESRVFPPLHRSAGLRALRAAEMSQGRGDADAAPAAVGGAAAPRSRRLRGAGDRGGSERRAARRGRGRRLTRDPRRRLRRSATARHDARHVHARAPRLRLSSLRSVPRRAARPISMPPALRRTHLPPARRRPRPRFRRR